MNLKRKENKDCVIEKDGAKFYFKLDRMKAAQIRWDNTENGSLKFSSYCMEIAIAALYKQEGLEIEGKKVDKRLSLELRRALVIGDEVDGYFIGSIFNAQDSTKIASYFILGPDHEEKEAEQKESKEKN